MLEGAALASWLEERAGKLTASRMADAIAFRQDGKPKSERIKLMQGLLAERLTNESIRHYVTPEMQWGLDNEAEAKAAYEAETGTLIRPCGFFDHPRIESFGATPDGLLGHDGLIETKCPTTSTFLVWSIARVVPEEYKPQMLAQLACTGRKWVDFVAYDPRILDEDRRLFVRRFVPKPEEIAAIEAAAEAFLAELDAMFDAFTAQPA